MKLKLQLQKLNSDVGRAILYTEDGLAGYLILDQPVFDLLITTLKEGVRMWQDGELELEFEEPENVLPD